MAVYAIGDIQGCAVALEELLDTVPDSQRPSGSVVAPPAVPGPGRGPARSADVVADARSAIERSRQTRETADRLGQVLGELEDPLPGD